MQIPIVFGVTRRKALALMAAGTSSWLIVWMTGCSAPNVIPGSIHFESLKHALDTLDPKEEVIVYCSNFGCTASMLVY